MSKWDTIGLGPGRQKECKFLPCRQAAVSCADPGRAVAGDQSDPSRPCTAAGGVVASTAVNASRMR